MSDRFSDRDRTTNHLKAAGGAAQRLRVIFLLPLVLIFAVTTAVLIVDTYIGQRRDLEIGIDRLRSAANDLYDHHVLLDGQTLKLAMQMLEKDEKLRDALAKRDRTSLLSQAAPLLRAMKSMIEVSHLYFIGPDRVTLLRVHQPDVYGDVVERITTRLAENTGKRAQGVEVGNMGTLTLRVVSPWFSQDGRTLLGYVELGMEIDRVLTTIRSMFGVRLVLVIRKEYLDQAGWERGMAMFGRTTNWNRFPNVVIVIEPASGIPPRLEDHLMHDRRVDGGNGAGMLLGRADTTIVFLPLNDVADRHVADLVLLADVADEESQARHLLRLTLAVTTTSSVILLAFFGLLAGRVGARIDRDERALQERASHDGLTGLYNHREFHAILERELGRAKRYSRTVALLMIDIDHFKKVNDDFGHVAGDSVLAQLALVLRQALRQSDSVCRYGGEEYTIVLPEVTAESAVENAERLRALVERKSFDIEGRTISKTVSIGVAAYPAHAASAKELIKAADAALYAAKAGGRNRVVQYQDALHAPKQVLGGGRSER